VLVRILGVPDEDTDRLIEWGDTMIGNTDPEKIGNTDPDWGQSVPKAPCASATAPGSPATGVKVPSSTPVGLVTSDEKDPPQ
jgi:hypothetical protein